jgi:hypothetical protein
MRATSMRRLLVGAAALMLAGATVLAASGSALGAKPTTGTRMLYVGPDSEFKLSPGVMTFTPVSVGGQTVSTVYVKNVDNQTLTHVTITFNNVQGGASIDSVYGPSKDFCPKGTSTVVCDFGNITAGGTHQFTLVINATAAQTATFSGQIIFNEATNPNGGNPQISTDGGTLSIATASCDAASTFVLPNIGQTVAPTATSCSADKQRSKLFVPANANGSVVSINDGIEAAVGSCGAYVCFGNEVNATVNGGTTVTPYLTWFITYSAETLGNINPKQVGFKHEGTVAPILPGKKGTCGAPEDFTNDCIVGTYTVNPDGSITWEIRTRTNSVMKGLH